MKDVGAMKCNSVPELKGILIATEARMCTRT
jgi:hypothetical protein